MRLSNDTKGVLGRIARASIVPLAVCFVLFGGMFLLVTQKIEIPFLYRVMPGAGR
jgi:hypothetical protein